MCLSDCCRFKREDGYEYFERPGVGTPQHKINEQIFNYLDYLLECIVGPVQNVKTKQLTRGVAKPARFVDGLSVRLHERITRSRHATTRG